MASNAEAYNATTAITDEPPLTEVDRWHKIFGYSRLQATKAIKSHRADVVKVRVSDDYWDLVQSQKKGYDREAYEHEMMLDEQRHSNSQRSLKAPRSTSNTSFLFKLGDPRLGEPLNTPEEVQATTDMAATPRVHRTFTGEQAGFCQVDAVVKQRIEKYFTSHCPLFRPTFIAFPEVRKDLFHTSAYPTLGLGTILPQNRPSNFDAKFSPDQSQYPVWYFFYGTLTNPVFLAGLFNLDQPPNLHAATISGGVIKTWANKYKALIDCPRYSNCRWNGVSCADRGG